MSRERDNCKGCVCAGCKKAQKNGNMFSCIRCTFPDCRMKLAHCTDCVPFQQEEGRDFDIWRM